jgi:hypothetical protein
MKAGGDGGKQRTPFMNNRVKSLFLGFLAGLLVIGSATMEDWFGRTYYSDDAIGYFDVSKAISRDDWALAFNPYWGYRDSVYSCPTEALGGGTRCVFGGGTTGVFGGGTTVAFGGGTTGVFGLGTTWVFGLGTTGVFGAG